MKTIKTVPVKASHDQCFDALHNICAVTIYAPAVDEHGQFDMDDECMASHHEVCMNSTMKFDLLRQFQNFNKDPECDLDLWVFEHNAGFYGFKELALAWMGCDIATYEELNQIELAEEIARMTALDYEGDMNQQCWEFDTDFDEDIPF